jgi:hypothetical protein
MKSFLVTSELPFTKLLAPMRRRITYDTVSGHSRKLTIRTKVKRGHTGMCLFEEMPKKLLFQPGQPWDGLGGISGLEVLRSGTSATALLRPM